MIPRPAKKALRRSRNAYRKYFTAKRGQHGIAHETNVLKAWNFYRIWALDGYPHGHRAWTFTGRTKRRIEREARAKHDAESYAFMRALQSSDTKGEKP